MRSKREMGSRPGAGGISLLELLITLVLMGILVAGSAPDLKQFVEARRADIIMARLGQAIELARIAAIRSGTLVTLCPSSDGSSCGGRWLQGVLVFGDANGDREINGDDVLLRSITFPADGGSLDWRAFQNRRYLQITPLGFTRHQNGNFTYCPANGDPHLARTLIVNRVARVRRGVDQDGDGIRENSRGRALDCGGG